MSSDRGRGREASRPRWLTLEDERNVLRVTVPDRPMVVSGRTIDVGEPLGELPVLRPARAGDRIEAECVDHHCTHHGDAPAFYRDSCDGNGSLRVTLTEDPERRLLDYDGFTWVPSLAEWASAPEYQRGYRLVGVTDE